MKHLLKLADLSAEEILDILNLADQLKYERKNGIEHHHLKGKTLGMIFQKSSTRTRVSFETGMYQLGGSALFLSDLESYTEYSLWQMFNWIPTDEEMEQWQHFLSTGKQRGTNQEFNKGVKELVSAYLADEITVDEFALEMQERADLMVGE